MTNHFFVSRSSTPRSEEDWKEFFHFNMWRVRLWPLKEVKEQDRLLWYDTKMKRLTWETEIVLIDGFDYKTVESAVRRLRKHFGDTDLDQPYIRGRPEPGYCLAYRSDPVRRLDLPAPEGFKMPMLGWLRADDTWRNTWAKQI